MIVVIGGKGGAKDYLKLSFVNIKNACKNL